MSAAIVLMCEAPMGQFGVCPARTPVDVETVNVARARAAARGWWHASGMGDRCPDHGPKRRSR